jgi:glycosyltransferase involved in cell wall biosynthesis
VTTTHLRPNSRPAQTNRQTGARRSPTEAFAVTPPSPEICALLLVRNGVDHDARVLRAARVAESTLGGRALIVGAATAASPAGPATVEGIAVLRLPARPPQVERAAQWIKRCLPRGSARASTTYAGSADGGVKAGSANGGVEAGSADGGVEAGSTSGVVGSTAPPRRARRILSGISYSLQAIVVARRMRPRLVHANDWNTMWAGLLVKLLCGAPLVYDSHELWADRNGRWEWRPWLLAGEALFVRVADEVLTSSPGYADVLATRYCTSRPTVVRNIPESHFAVPAQLPAGSSDVHDGALRSFADRSRMHERPAATAGANGGRPALALVVYIGGLMPGRGLEQMIDALPLVPEARLRAIGPVAPRYRASLLSRAETAGVTDRIELRSPVPPAEVGSALAGAAVGLCLIQPICRSYELSLPNKLFEYTAAGVPVLASDLPVIGELVRRDGFGALTSAGDPDTIAASLERLLEPDSWRRAAQCAHAFAATHSWASEARTLAAAYRRGGR